MRHGGLLAVASPSVAKKKSGLAALIGLAALFGSRPYVPKPGDRVRVWTPSYQGIGTVTRVSTDYEVGWGTKLYPSYHIEFDDGEADWFNAKSISPLR